ncbi:MAG: hypothetical protein DRQ88_03330 [Epsilonproteobacteria bacterium]|nr:MAG: hypothetical protein DRQ89_01430 [Campylobacterota bacterium]RLA67351.1 MAG: hypothetical protein DRQ88_03330 [Campylobacterota bacterium]
MESNKISLHLAGHLEAQICGKSDLAEVYRYSVLPAGKLFRPSLVWATANDLGENICHDKNSDHAYLASAVEIHHAYTLVHDDLPCMDDDEVRRGKPSVHKAFGEYKALLAGDGLLNASYGLLSHINSPHLGKVLRLFSKYLGPQGLIQGQANDLSGEISKSFKNLLDTHNLKTGRLIQVSILGSYLLTDKFSYRVFIDLMKLGYHMGIVFQLLDDFTEFTEKNLSGHEHEVNPWLKYGNRVQETLEYGMDKIDLLSSKHELSNLEQIITDYYQKITNKLNQGKENLRLNGVSDLTADSVSNFISKRYH